MRLSMRHMLLIAVLIGAAGGWLSAQVFVQPVVPPEVVSGGEMGFRIEGRKGDTPVGTLVIRQGGKWVPVEFAGTNYKRATQ